MEGTTASMKRKIFHVNEEEDDEEKMEKFFALIKRIREARDHLTKCSVDEFQAEVINKNMKKQKVEEAKPIAVWNPSFQREDFMDDAQFRSPSVTLVGTSQRKEGTEKEDIKEGLDLKLSL